MFLLAYTDISFNFTIVNSTIEIQHSNTTSYPSNLVIPEKIKFQNSDFSVTSLGESLFENSSIEYIKFHDKITSIKSSIFRNCFNLKKVDMQVLNLTRIPDHMFDSCTSLTQIILPLNIIEIGKFSFYNCSNLQTIDIENSSITTLSDYSFANCAKLITIKLPKNLCQIGEYCFANTSLNTLHLPETTRKLCEGAFYHTKLENLEISDCLISKITSYSFAHCNLTSIFLHPSIRSLGISCFEGNKFLKSIDISYTNVVIINSSAFKDCSSLSSISFSIITNFLGDHCFEGTNFTHFETPDSVHHLGMCVFKNCPNLVQADLGSISFDKVPYGFFWNCHKFNSIKLPRHQFFIEPHAFEGTGFTHIRFPNSLLGIGDYAFSHCHNALTIDISNLEFTLTGTHIFEDCPNVETFLYAEEDIYFPDYLLSGCGLSSLVLPANIIGIGFGCFMNCKNLRTVNLLKTSITKIPDYAFFGCNLSTILLPKSVNEIGLYSLGHNTSTTIIYYGHNVPNFGYTDTFGSIFVHFDYPTDLFCGQNVERVRLREIGENGEELPEIVSDFAYSMNYFAIFVLTLFLMFQFKRLYSLNVKRFSRKERERFLKTA